MLENVEGLVALDGRKVLRRVLDTLRELGDYEIHHEVLNTRDHGLPHCRFRLYCVGIHKSTLKGGSKETEASREQRTCWKLQASYMDPPSQGPKLSDSCKCKAHGHHCRVEKEKRTDSLPEPKAWRLSPSQPCSPQR